MKGVLLETQMFEVRSSQLVPKKLQAHGPILLNFNCIYTVYMPHASFFRNKPYDITVPTAASISGGVVAFHAFYEKSPSP